MNLCGVVLLAACLLGAARRIIHIGDSHHDVHQKKSTPTNAHQESAQAGEQYARHSGHLEPHSSSQSLAEVSYLPPKSVRVPSFRRAAEPTMDVERVVVEPEGRNGNEPVEKMLARFKRKVRNSGHIFVLRRKRQFESNTEKRIRKSKESLKRQAMERRKRERSQF